MTGRSLVIVGASGFGREALDVVRAHNAAHPEDAFEVTGVLDDGPSDANLARLDALGVPFLGGVDAHLAGHAPGSYLLGIGSPRVRRALVARFDAAGWVAPSVVHPSATIGSVPDFADGVVVCAGVQVSTNVTLGRHVHVNPHATIGHDAVVEDFASLNPGSIISGECRVADGTLVGAGAIVLQGLTVGRDVTVGAGAVVTKAVPDERVVKGVPGRWSE